MSGVGEDGQATPPRIARRILSWAARRLDSDDLLTTADDLFRQRSTSAGARHARRWYNRQARIALLHALRHGPAAERRALDSSVPFRLRESIFREFRLSFRRIMHAPMRALSFAGIVGVGIAAAAFMIQVRATMLKPDLGLARPAHVVNWRFPEGQTSRLIPVSPDDPWVARPHESIGELVPLWPASLAIETLAGNVRASGYRSPPGVLAAFGRAPSLGRDLEGPGEIVLSYRLWTVRFGADPSAMGTSIDLDEDPHVIVGVAPPDFDGPLCCVPPDFWVAAQPGTPASEALLAIIDAAEIESPTAWLADVAATVSEGVQPELTEAATAPYGGDQGVIGRTLLVLLALSIVAWVGTLLSGANLVLVDTLDRARELRLRRALGSNSAHMALRTFAETAWLAALAAALAIVVAATLVWVAPWLLPMIGGRSSVEVSVGRPVLGAIGLAAAIVTVLCSLPATFAGLTVARQVVERGPARNRLASVGLAAQVSLAAVLLVVTGFLVNSIRSLDGDFVGFRNGATAVHHISTASADDGPTVSRLAEELRANAPSANVAVTRRLPVYGAVRDTVRLPDGTSVYAAMEIVTPSFFDVIGSALVAGAASQRADEAVVSEGLAVRLAGTATAAIGTSFTVDDSVEVRVVGVVEDATWGSGSVRPTVYRGWSDDPIRAAVILVGPSGRGPLSGAGKAPQVGELLAALRPLDIALQPFETLDGLLVRSRVLNVFIARLALLFGALCTIVAFGGVHAHFARWVRMRRKALAIQRALGSPRVGQARSIAAAALRIIVPASVVGAVGGWSGGRAMQSLFAVPTPPALLPVVVAVVLILASLLALIAPVARANRIDPLALLKAE